MTSAGLTATIDINQSTISNQEIRIRAQDGTIHKLQHEKEQERQGLRSEIDMLQQEIHRLKEEGQQEVHRLEEENQSVQRAKAELEANLAESRSRQLETSGRRTLQISLLPSWLWHSLRTTALPSSNQVVRFAQIVCSGRWSASTKSSARRVALPRPPQPRRSRPHSS